MDAGHATATYTLPPDDLQPGVYGLLRWADERRLTLSGLRVHNASLEDVFLSTAGVPS